MRTLKIMDLSGEIFYQGFDYMPNDIRRKQRIATEKGIRNVVVDRKEKTKRLILISL